MNESWFDKVITEELRRREESSQLRRRRLVRGVGGMEVLVESEQLINFSSNDYLGLAHHPRILEAAARAGREQGLGSGASALVTGYTNAHVSAESAIARWKGAEGAVLLPSGYQAAHAAIQTIAGVAGFHRPGVRFLVDKLAHASLIDAISGTGATMRVFPHNHMGKLARLLAEAPEGEAQVVVTESIFSMDGDAADLAGIAKLKQSHTFTLLLDEAHASGVYGPGGAGYAAESGLSNIVDVSIVTLSKALGGGGGAVCGSRVFCDAMVNWGRAYIYSTAISPMLAGAAEMAIAILAEEPWRQGRVRELARLVREKLAAAGVKVGAGDSPIIPILMGSEEAALKASASLRERGMLISAIRPPTVPRGSSRLRVTLSCEHCDEQVQGLVEALVELRGAGKLETRSSTVE